MRFLDKLVEKSFKINTNGKSVIFPWGPIGKGYLVPDEDAKNSLRRVFKLNYIILFPLCFVSTQVYRWPWLLAILPFYFVWFYFAIIRKAKRWEISDTKFTFRESIERTAEIYNTKLLWIMVVLILFPLMASLAILVGIVESENRYLIGFLGLLLFGLCIFLFLYMIQIKKHNKAISADAKTRAAD